MNHHHSTLSCTAHIYTVVLGIGSIAYRPTPKPSNGWARWLALDDKRNAKGVPRDAHARGTPFSYSLSSSSTSPMGKRSSLYTFVTCVGGSCGGGGKNSMGGANESSNTFSRLNMRSKIWKMHTWLRSPTRSRCAFGTTARHSKYFFIRRSIF